MPAPLTLRDIKRRKGSDDVQSLKRRVVRLSRLEHEVVHLEDGPVLVRVRRFRDPALVVKTLRERGRLDRTTFLRAAELEAPPASFERTLFATCEHDLAILASPAAQILLREHRRAFARYGPLDQRSWLEDRRARLAALRDAAPPARWTHAVVELVIAQRGADEGLRVSQTFAELDAEPSVRKADALARIVGLEEAMRTGAPAPELGALYERLEAARDWPGRARRRRTLDVLRHALGWTEAPAHVLGDDLDDLVGAARRAIAIWPLRRDEVTTEAFAALALAFRVAEQGVPSLGEVHPPSVLSLRNSDLTVAQAVALTFLAKAEDQEAKGKLARLVANGLDLDLLRTAAEHDQLEAVSELDDVRSARAFLTWSTRLRDHHAKLSLELSPRLFRSLPRNEDLSVLTMCLLDQHAAPTSDPIATLDATLGLFERLPGRARSLLDRLRDFTPGAGARLDPTFAAFVADDALLDRAIHVAELAGEPGISAMIREDFTRVGQRHREREHLEGLADRSLRQQQRLDALDLTAYEAPLRERTLRRLRARIERLMPRAYQHAMDETFRRLLREGWNIRLPHLTTAWRDAVRFWLLVEDNRALLEKLLREAAQRPGQSVKDAFPENQRWLASMRGKVDLDAWLAPRREEVVHRDARYVISLEEDPLEVLRMGIPFGTCLALANGSNAASTVMNAIEANKRVLYVHNAAGKVVARKLLALTDTGKLVGYRFYRSVGGEDERVLESAVMRFCQALGRACGAELAAGPAPRTLHRSGFWYNDGEVPFDAGPQDALAEFCEAHDLRPIEPLVYDDALKTEMNAWRARRRGDVDHALSILDEASDDSLAIREHGLWLLDHLGHRRATATLYRTGAMGHAVFEGMARDEAGLLLTLETAGRLRERLSENYLPSTLAQFPPSVRSNRALVELALRTSQKRVYPTTRGHVHLTLHELPARFEDVDTALDLVDAIEPAWQWLASRSKHNETAVAAAVLRAANAIEEIFERAPEPDVVAHALMSRHRGAFAHRAALRVAARHQLTGGERALRRFAVLRPELMTKGDALAALLRQTGGAITSAPVPDESPFPALRELVALPNIHRLLGRWDSLEGEPRCTWEAAWRRRRRKDPPGGYDAVAVERARKALSNADTADAERTAARDLVFEAGDTEVVDQRRLLATAARLGDVETARRAMSALVRTRTSPKLPPAVVVDLWRLGAVDVVTTSFAKTAHDEWSARVRAVERAAGDADMRGLLEAVALALVESPAELACPDSLAQLHRVIGVVVREAPEPDVARLFVELEDALAAVTFRDALAKAPAARVAAIHAELRKLDLRSPRAKLFFAWISDIGGIESS